MKKVGITIDEWKLPIFERHLETAGFAFRNAGRLVAGTLFLTVQTDETERLGEVVRAAAEEAWRTGPPKAANA